MRELISKGKIYRHILVLLFHIFFARTYILNNNNKKKIKFYNINT